MSEDGGAFGERLRACRHSAALSQQELAERSGLSVRAISDLERGRTRWPYPDSLHRLADALGLRGEARTDFVAAAGRRLAGVGMTGGVRAGDSAGRAGRVGKARHGAAGRHVVPRCLPAAVPGFVGRDDQLAALTRLLQQPGGAAVVTAIGGIAGVGKSALALQWAHEVAPDFTDGQLFVNLRGFDPAEAPATPAEAVRLFLDALQIPAERIPQTLEGQLGLYRSLLAGKRMLVVLDNARDVTQVRPLLPGSPTCRVVITSRNQLTGLAALEGAHLLLLDVLSGAEAQLLLRGRLGAERLAAEPGATSAIIGSCAHLPLALSVIAARVALRPELSLADVAADLARREDLDGFTDGGEPAADVRLTFSWSYRQLDAGAARVFRLAALHPGADLERCAVAALADTTADQAGRTMDVLTAVCMIQPAGSGRFRLHDLLRRYAYERVTREDGEPERRAALRRLLDYYVSATAAAMDAAFPSERDRRPRLPAPGPLVPRFPDAAGALAWLDAERPNLAAVAAHATERGWPRHAIWLSAILFRYLDTQGHFAEANAIYAYARQAAVLDGDQAAEADTLNNLGNMNLRQGRYQQAGDHFEMALARYRQAANRGGAARALSNLGFINFLRGRARQASEDLSRALDMFREIGDQLGLARTLASLGYVDLRQGRYEQAADHLRQSVTVCRDVRDRGGEARALGILGEVELERGRLPEGAEHVECSLTIFQEIGDRISEADSLTLLGVIDLRRGRYEHAAGCLQQALALCEATGDLSSLAGALTGLGELLLATGRCEAARKRLAAAVDAAAQADETYVEARANELMARTCEAGHDPAGADRYWARALALYTELDAPEAGRVRARLAPGPAPEPPPPASRRR